MKRYIELNKPVAITAYSCVGGKKEKDGPLSQGFDLVSSDDYFGRKTWEKAETAMQKLSIRTLLDKRNLKIRTAAATAPAVVYFVIPRNNQAWKSILP